MSQAVTGLSLTMMTSTVSEELFARDTHRHRHTAHRHRHGLGSTLKSALQTKIGNVGTVLICVDLNLCFLVHRSKSSTVLNRYKMIKNKS